MKEFMQTYRVFLTPISPIHIGCGEDFEPTNYVIDENVLYHFDPAQLKLSPQQRNKLFNLVCSNKIDLIAIQRFFLEHKKQALTLAHYFANTTPAIEQHWCERIGKSQQIAENNKAIAKLSIERTAYLPYNSQAYIPASSLKGALATAMLDYEHQRKGNPPVRKNEHKKLLEEYVGTFDKSKLRHIKFADFIPNGELHTKICFNLNFPKTKLDGVKLPFLALRREVIMAGQYRALESDLTLSIQQNGLVTLMGELQKLNLYHQPIFDKECDLLVELGLIDENWKQSVSKLLKPNTYLIRLGKNGSESKSYRGEGVAQITIRSKDGNTIKDSATTLWLLSGNDEKQTKHLLPLGWALLEIDPQDENSELKQWCANQFDCEHLFDKSGALKARQDLIEKELAEKARLAEQQEAQLKEEAEKQAMLNSLNSQQKSVMDFVENVNNTRELQADTTGSAILKALTALIENALAWNAEDKAFLLENIPLDLIKSKVKLNKKDSEKNIKKQFNKLNQ